MLILMSPYTSIRDVVRSLVGRVAQYLVADRFRNIDEIAQVQCPCFFIHGKKDSLIPESHTKDLFLNCNAIAEMHLSETMTHNGFSMSGDILRPLRKFLKQVGYIWNNGGYTFPSYVTTTPLKKYKKRSNSLSSTTAYTKRSASSSTSRTIVI